MLLSQWMRCPSVLLSESATPSVYIVPGVTWFLGLVSSILIVWFTSRSSLKREHELKRIERREAWRIRRNGFQRETLLSLQDALSELCESTGMVYGTRSANSGGVMPHSLLEARRKANTKVSVLE